MNIGYPVPPLGEYPDFDRFVDFHLSEQSDTFDERMSFAAELFYAMGGDPADVQMQLHDEYSNLVEEQRAECWWAWRGAETDPWECLCVAQSEIARLTKENVTLRSECDALSENNALLMHKLGFALDEVEYHRRNARCRYCRERFDE